MLSLEFQPVPRGCKTLSNSAGNRFGRWCFGKTPMHTFLDSLPIAKEKSMAT